MLTASRAPTIPFIRDRATWLAYLSVGLFAFLQASLGPLMPSLREALGFGYTVASFHFSAMALGLVMVGFAGDRIARLALRGGAAVLPLPFALGLLADVVGIERAYGIVPPLLLAALITVLRTTRSSTTGTPIT